MTIMKPDGTEIKLDEPVGVSPTLEERVRSLESNQKYIIETINSWSNVMNIMIANSNKIYPQIDTSYQDNAIHIRAPKEIVHSTSLLLVLPTETINPPVGKTTIKAKLVIHAGGQRIELPIVKEDYNGNIVGLTTGDIVSNRLCVFRFDHTTSNRVILCHSLSFDSLGVNHLVCNDATFNSFPVINMGNGNIETVLSASTAAKLEEDLDNRYQKKIIFGTVSPEEYIKNNYLEEGQLYIQKEE